MLIYIILYACIVPLQNSSTYKDIQIRKLMDILPNIKCVLFFIFQQSISSNTFDIKNAVTQLSEYILKIDDAKLFKKYLSSILLALVSAKIPLKPVFSNINSETYSDSEKNCHLEYSIILAALSDHPDILQ